MLSLEPSADVLAVLKVWIWIWVWIVDVNGGGADWQTPLCAPPDCCWDPPPPLNTYASSSGIILGMVHTSLCIPHFSHTFPTLRHSPRTLPTSSASSVGGPTRNFRTGLQLW